MTDAHTLLTVAMLIGYGLISGLTSAFIAVYLVRRRDAHPAAAKPVTPHAVNPARPRVPRPPEPATALMPPVSQGLVVYDRGRVDLIGQHAERAARARGEVA